MEEGKEAKLDATSLAVLVARVGATDQKIVTSTIEEGRLGKFPSKTNLTAFSSGW